MDPLVSLITLSLLMVFAAQARANREEDDPKVTYHPSDWKRAPFSEAVQVGQTLYLSGQLGTVPGAGLIEGGVQAETRQILENIKAVLEKHGSSLDKVVKCTVFMADIEEWKAMNEVYVTYFPNLPARSAFGGVELALDARLEIECIAVV